MSEIDSAEIIGEEVVSTPDTDETEQNRQAQSETTNEEDTFKKPTVIGCRPPSKGILHKYLLSKKSAEKEESTSGKPVVVAEPPPPIPYEEPEWKGVCEEEYFIEEVKSGVIEKRIDLRNKSLISFGRIEYCDVPMAHPTVSRYHAVLQYRGAPDGDNEKGFYLYDLKSTHGTFLNKYRIKPRVYARVKVGHMVKIGASSRFFILQGPPTDEEDESELTVTELKQKRQAELEQRKRLEEQERLEEEMEKERQERLIEERGISWGMGDDADEETDLSENPYAVLTNEELYIDDPKKALRMWFEREGHELHYDIEKAEKGMFACRLVLPVDDGEGRDITIHSSGRNKRDAQVQCATEACRTIDKLGLLRASKQESRKKQKKNWEENDYYDSDEDSFLDRTGDLEKKRQKRMREAGKIQDTVETYESLTVKYEAVLEKLSAAEQRLADLTAKLNSSQEPSEDEDALDAFMASLKHSQPSKMDIKTAKINVSSLKEEESHLKKLIDVVKPANVPAFIKQPKPPQHVSKESDKTAPKRKSDESSDLREKVDQNEEKTKPVIGPILPSDSASQLKPTKRPKPSKKPKNEAEAPDDDFVDLVWKPPAGQTGDGRTALNDKLGY